MITLDEAKKIVLEKHPKEYIYLINDYADFWAFVLLNKGEKFTNTTFVAEDPIVYKSDGRFEDNVPLFDPRLLGNFKNIKP